MYTDSQEAIKSSRYQGTVIKRAMISRSMLQLRIGAKAFQDQPWLLGTHLILKVTKKRQRAYTIWDYDAGAGTFDLLVSLHGDGPGVSWASKAQIGDTVLFHGPVCDSFTIDTSLPPYYLFAGEETGAIAIQGKLHYLPSDTSIMGYLEADAPEEELPMPGAPLPWLHRLGQPVLPTGKLVAAIRALDLPPYPGKAYFAGESAVCLALKSYLVNERGWPREQVHVRPFWVRNPSAVRHFLAQLGGVW